MSDKEEGDPKTGLVLEYNKMLSEAEKLANIGHWELDLVKDKLYWSDQIFRIFELDKNTFEASYEGFLKAIHPEDREKVNKAYIDSLENKKAYEISHKLLMARGKVKYVLEKCTTDFDDQGKPIRSFGTVQDITVQINAQNEKEEVQAQLFHTAKLATIGELSASIAHEINNPLSILSMAIMALEGRCQKDEFDFKAAAEIFLKQKDAIGRISNIVNNLRTYARTDSAENEIFGVNGMVDDALRFVKEIYEKKGITFKVLYSEDEYFIYGSPGRFQQVLINLFSNARDAILSADKQKKTITLKIQKIREQILISVADNGCGMPKEVQENIFKSFYTTKKVGVGTGLGLSIVKKLMEDFDGEITVKSEEDRGTSFFVSFPAIDSKSGKVLMEGREEDKNSLEALSQESNSVISVLFVDDEVDYTVYMAEMLGLQKYDVDWTYSPEEALEKAKSKDYDVIITDYHMPLMNGEELIQKLKNELLYKGKIILISGALSELKDIPADLYLSKPFELKELVLGINKLLVDKG